MWLLYDSVHPRKSGQVWCFFFFLTGGVVFYKAASTKKLLCKSHSSLNSVWWAVLTLKTGSEHSLAYIFQEICDSCCGECLLFFCFWRVFSDLQSCFLFRSSSLVSLLTGACCSLHTTQFFKCCHAVLDQGKTLFNRPGSAVTVPLLFDAAFFIVSVLLNW